MYMHIALEHRRFKNNFKTKNEILVRFANCLSYILSTITSERANKLEINAKETSYFIISHIHL